MSRVFRPIDHYERQRAAGSSMNDRRGRLMVEAAAGTGKTTVLLSRVLAYLISGDRPLSQIAVVTFTDAAAAELKLRLRHGIARQLADPETGSEVRERLRSALEDLETAAVGTIHSFCLDLLKARPVEARIDPGFRVADAFGQRLLMARAWEILLRRVSLDEPGLAAAADLDLLSEEKLRPIAFRLIRDGVGADPSRLPEPIFETEDDLDREVEARWQAIGRDLAAAQADAVDGGALASRVAEARDAWRALDGLPRAERYRLIIEGEPKISKVGGTKAEAEAKALRLQAIEARDALRADLIHHRLAVLLRWLVVIDGIYAQLTTGNSQLDFDQLIRLTLETLKRSPEVLADFRRRYPVIMVDEFQDTDPVQTELLLLLAGPEDFAPDPADTSAPRSLFLVGDPKQSIYRFRGADLENYNRVLDTAFGEDRRLFLAQTFRSVPAIADYVNEVMAKVMAPPAGDSVAAPDSDSDPDPVAEPHPSWEATYRPLEARIPAALPDSAGVLSFGYRVAPDAGVGEARENEAAAFAQLVHHLVVEGRADVRQRDGDVETTRPARFGDVALLLPKMTVLSAYEEAFNRHRIPFRVVGGRHYFRRDEVHALIQVLKALADPGDSVAVVSVLRGPAFGIADPDLMAYSLARRSVRSRPRLDAAQIASSAAIAASPSPAAAARVARALTRLAEIRSQVATRPLPELVARVLDLTGLLPFYALEHRGDQRLANLMKVVDVARRVQASGIESLPAFIRWLDSLLEEEPDESDSPYLEGGESAVRIMTVHKAKGLEFPIVLLGALASGSAHGGSGLRLLPRQDGSLAASLRKGFGSHGDRDAVDDDFRREEAEARRLLYVALTRARDLLVLPRMETGEGTDGVSGRSSSKVSMSPIFRQLYERGEGHPDSVKSFVRRLDAHDLRALPEVEAPPPIELKPGAGRGLAEERQRFVETLETGRRAQPASFVRASHSVVQEGAGQRSGETAVITADRAAALDLGTAAHEVIAESLQGESPEGQAPVGERSSAVGFGGEDVTAETLAATFLGSSLADRARAADERLIEENLVTMLADGRIFEGQVDLAFIEEGEWVIVDHKSDRVDEAGAAEKALSHASQLTLYAEVLTRITGRPVREAWVFFLRPGLAVPIDLPTVSSPTENPAD